MTHKKYIKKGGKIFGPYIYENYRVDGKTKTRYLGREENTKSLWVNSFVYLPIFLALIAIFVLGFFYMTHSGVTGKAVLEVGQNYLAGEKILGKSS